MGWARTVGEGLGGRERPEEPPSPPRPPTQGEGWARHRLGTQLGRRDQGSGLRDAESRGQSLKGLGEGPLEERLREGPQGGVRKPRVVGCLGRL